MTQGRLQRSQHVGHVDILPVAAQRLMTGRIDKHRQVGLVADFPCHLLAAAQQVVLGACLESLPDECQHTYRVNGRQVLLHELQLLLTGYQVVVSIEVSIYLIHNGGRRRVVPVGHMLTHLLERLPLGTVNLLLRETIVQNLLLMADKVGDALAQLTWSEFHRGIGSSGGTKEPAVLHRPAGIGRVVERQGVEALLHQTVHQVALQILAIAFGRGH